MFNNTSDSKMQLVGRGDLQPPGTCMVCGSGNYDYGYVNLGLWIEFHGNCYICAQCLVEAAEIIGMLTSEEAKKVLGDSAKLLEQNAILTTQLEEANARLRVFDDALRSISAGTNLAVSVSETEGSVAVSDVASTDSGEAGEPESEESVKGSKRSRPNRIKLSDITEPTGDESSDKPGLL